MMIVIGETVDINNKILIFVIFIFSLYCNFFNFTRISFAFYVFTLCFNFKMFL